MRALFFALLAVTLTAPAVTSAQEARGAIQGHVSDESGAAIPGASVEVLNVATGVTTTATSNDNGNYRVPFLNPGTYRVTVALDGFTSFVRDGIELHVADLLAVDATLQVGQVTDQVQVTATGAAVDRVSASLGQVVDARRIAELPIREGSAVELVSLAPGVVNTTDLRLRKAAFNNGLSQFSTVGIGEKQNNFTLDGVANVANDRVAYSPPSAAVEEFKIHTTTYDSAIGNTMGAVVNIVTKSGTNELQGQAYEWYRSSALDAPNFFDERADVPKRDYTDHRFGAAVGGPVVSSRTFYFASVEANPFEVPQPTVQTVPTERMRRGDFSELLALGPEYQIYDPATTRPHPTEPGRFIRDPFPGNFIPAGRIDPVARAILEYWPLPNQDGTTDGRDNYTNPTLVADETYYTATGRIDHSVSNRHRIYGRFSWDFWEEEKNDWFGNLSNGIVLHRKNRVLAVDDAYTIRSNLLVNVRGGFTRQLFPERRRSEGFDLASLGFSPSLVALAPEGAATFPFLDYADYADFSDWESGDGYFTTDVYSANGSLMWLAGNHNLKLGTEYRYYIERASRFPTAVSPSISFDTDWTRGPLDNSPDAPIGQDLASFLLGYPTGGEMSRAAEYSERTSVMGFYAQDDWRVRGNLTLNLGLRYEIEAPLTEAQNRMISGFDFDTPLPNEDTVRATYARTPIAEVPVDQFRVRGGMLYPDTGGPSEAWERNLANLMPRAGFSWLATATTAVRGGYGLFYDMLGANRMTVNQVGFTRDTAIVPSLDSGQTFIATLANPLPDGLLEPTGSSLGLMTNVGLGAAFPYVADVETPRSHRWSLGVQQELPWQILVEATYVGAHSEHLPVTRELNPVPREYLSTSPVRDDATHDSLTAAVPNPFASLLPGTDLAGDTVEQQQLLRPYPQFTSIDADETIGAIDYHALQGRIERRMSSGLTLQMAYTWSRTMSETAFLNDTDQRPERVIGPFDRTHVLSTSGIWEVPAGRGRHWGNNWRPMIDGLLGGWQVSFLFKAQSGAPLGFGNFLLAEGATVDDIALPGGDRGFERWFNTDAFVRASSEQLVSNVRTRPTRFSEVRGPGYAVLDLGFLKNLSLGSRARLQLRFEVYNALNRTNLINPNTSPTSSAFGTITRQNGLPRQLQLAARVSF
ncbi:MAG: carboxypeptidase regulatory-like domain-containing protein [Vicinamibacteraceae bacterium]